MHSKITLKSRFIGDTIAYRHYSAQIVKISVLVAYSGLPEYQDNEFEFETLDQSDKVIEKVARLEAKRRFPDAIFQSWQRVEIGDIDEF